MSLVEIIILGVALAMDAFAVTVSNMFVYKNLTRGRMFLMPLFFGVFQGLMPLIGYFAGNLVSDFISQYAGIITFVILGFIGAKMIWDAFHEDKDEGNDTKHTPEETSVTKSLTIPTLFFQAIATSIDALMVGVSFAALAVNPFTSAGVITITTFLCVCIALVLGRRFGNALGEKATIIGGIVLICIGVKALF